MRDAPPQLTFAGMSLSPEHRWSFTATLVGYAPDELGVHSIYSREITYIPEQRERKVLADYYEARGSFPRGNRQEA